MDILAPATAEEALDLAVVDGFVSTTTALIAGMPLQAVVGGEVVATPPILRNPVPGPNRTLHDFIVEFVADLCLWGNYLAVIGDPSWTGWPDQLYGIPWGAWTADPDGTYLIGGTRYGAAEVFHVAVRRRTGDRVGRGLLQTHRRLLASAVAAEAWASRYYDGGAVPPALLTSADPEMTQAKADLLKVKLRAATRNREPVVVPAGTVLQALSSDADSAQLNETRKANSLALCQALGIPAALLGLDSPSLTYRNIGEVFQQFITTTVMGYVQPLEAQLTLQCLPRGTEAHFETASILRPDYAARVDLAVKGLQGRVMTTNESRALIDLPPVEVAEDAAPPLALVPSQEMAQ